MPTPGCSPSVPSRGGAVNWSRLKLPAIVALVVADVVLVGRALNPPVPPSLEGTSATPATSTTSTSAPSTSTTSTASPTSSASTASTRRAKRVSSIIFAVDDQSAWLAGVGSCANGGATFETTSDGGASWQSQSVPLSTIDRVYASSSSKGFVVGSAGDCTLAVLGTGNAGGTWSSPQSASSTWALDPTSTTHLVRPGGDAIQPCGKKAVADFSRVSDQGGLVLCADGRVRSSSDLGQTWTDVGQAHGAYAVSSPGGLEDAAVVVGVRDGCDGVGIASMSTSGKVSDIACVKGAPTPTPGKLAVSVARQAGWLLVGDQVWRSSDLLRTWSKAGTVSG